MGVLMPLHIAEMVRGSRYGVPVVSDRWKTGAPFRRVTPTEMDWRIHVCQP